MTEKINIVLDASKIDLFETCPARYNFRHNLNKTLPLIHKAKALDLGSLAHEGLAVYYKLLGEGISYAERSEAALMKIRELSSNPKESNSEPEEVEVLLKAVEQSCDYWRAEDENCLEILAVEQPFAYVLFEDDIVRIIISGKIDLLANFIGIGRNASYERLPIDHKTFSRDSVLLRKSNQFINYCAAAESNYLVVNRIGLQKTLNAEEKFKRLPLSYDPIYIADWKDNLRMMILNEYLTCVANEVWPEKPTSCNKFNRLCEYYDICDSSGQDVKELKLERNYVTAPEWDVTKLLTAEEVK
ncbi:PD-(D/E)XK nuclease family protein [Candidatus Pacearchaeota archaeon]|nr:PD-(D/E)XK nuclease family protein [Candidatus Pacearchaeota archaeon]